jgi:hypothetical protein
MGFYGFINVLEETASLFVSVMIEADGFYEM